MAVCATVKTWYPGYDHQNMQRYGDDHPFLWPTFWSWHPKIWNQWPIYSLMMSLLPGWWLTYPSEKYEFVSWDDHSQYMENKSHVPNHPPVTHVCFPCQISRVYIYPKSLSYLPFPYFRGFHGPQDEKPMWFHEKWRVSKSPRLY